MSIVDPAQAPKLPSSPKLLINLAIALLAGLGIGAALAFGLEQIDESITDPAEAQRELGLPLLGSLPQIDAAPKDNMLARQSDLVAPYLPVQPHLSFSTVTSLPSPFPR